MTIDNTYRMCVITRNKLVKRDLFRVVRTPSGVVLIDTKQNLPGRGCYISKNEEIILKAKKKHSLSKALKCEVDDSYYDELLKLL